MNIIESLRELWSLIPDDFEPTVRSILFLISGFLAGLILNKILVVILKIIQKRTDSYSLKSVLKYVTPKATLFFPLLFTLVTLSIQGWPPAIQNSLNIIFQTIFYIVIAMVLIGLTNVFDEVIRHQYNLDELDNFDERKIVTQLQYVRRIAIIVIIIFAIAFIIIQFESVREFGRAMLTSAGVAGIIIGFAAQKTIANLLAGMQIAFTQPIRIDDVVIVESEWGRIEEITLTYVVVKIWDQRRLVVPLNYFIEKPFQNWTRSSADLIGSVFLYVDYHVPIDSLREELDKILKNHRLWDQRVQVIQVTDSFADGMQLRILVSARNAPEAWDLRCDVREGLISFIQKEYPESLPTQRLSINVKGKSHEFGSNNTGNTSYD